MTKVLNRLGRVVYGISVMVAVLLLLLAAMNLYGGAVPILSLIFFIPVALASWLFGWLVRFTLSGDYSRTESDPNEIRGTGTR